MMTIGITGGKGGTGKSTVAILLANQYFQEGQKVILVDSDIECPNDYLLLGQVLGKPVEKTYTRFPKLRASLFALKLNILLKFKRLLKYK